MERRAPFFCVVFFVVGLCLASLVCAVEIPGPPPGPVTLPPAVTLPAGTELVTQPNLREGLRGWTIEEWMKPSDGKGEVSRDNNSGVMFRGTTGNNRIGIMQSLNNLNVLTYGKIILTAQIRTEEQTLDGTGWQGREAPVGVFVSYTDVNGLVHNGLPIMPSEPQTNRMFWEGFYHVDPTGNSRNWHGTKVGKGQWYTYQYDLMTLNPRPKVLHYVGAEGAGWPTREGRIALLSLRGQAAAFTELVAGKPVELTALEFRLLAALLEADGRVLTRERLMDAIYGDGEAFVLDRTVDAMVKRLREKLSDNPEQPRYIATVRGVGYRAARLDVGTA